MDGSLDWIVGFVKIVTQVLFKQHPIHNIYLVYFLYIQSDKYEDLSSTTFNLKKAS